MKSTAFWVGIFLIIIGCLMFLCRKEEAAENGVEFLGIKFKLSHPTLVIIILGFILVVTDPKAFLVKDSPEIAKYPTTTELSDGSTTKPTTPAKPLEGSMTKPPRSVKDSQGPAPTSATPTEPETIKPADSQKPISRVRVATTPSPTWVYLGTAEGKSLPSQTFNVTEFPMPGQEIKAVMPVNTREAAPFTNDGDHWYFGRKVGFIEKGDRVSVRSLQTIKMSEDAPEYIWAEVDVISKPAQ